jgi:hypothetical protein
MRPGWVRFGCKRVGAGPHIRARTVGACWGLAPSGSTQGSDWFLCPKCGDRGSVLLCTTCGTCGYPCIPGVKWRASASRFFEQRSEARNLMGFWAQAKSTLGELWSLRQRSEERALCLLAQPENKINPPGKTMPVTTKPPSGTTQNCTKAGAHTERLEVCGSLRPHA